MTIFTDNFDDNVLDLNKWQKVSYLSVASEPAPSIDTIERNQRLELVVTAHAPEGTGWGNMGVVSRDRYDLRKGKIQAYVANTAVEPYSRIMIFISPTKLLDNWVETLESYYFIELDNYYNTCRVVRRAAGSLVELYEGTAAAMSNVLKIELEAGFIKFYEGNNLRVYDAYALPSYECYIYLLQFFSVGYGTPTGTYVGWFDDFYCEYAGTTEEKQEAQTLITQQAIAEFIKANWLPLSVLGIIIAIVIAIVLGVW